MGRLSMKITLLFIFGPPLPGTHVLRHLGFRVSVTPFTYLGVLIFRGRRILFQYLVNEGKASLSSSKGKLLLMAGWVQSIQFVYQSLFLHSFSVYQCPACLLKHFST